MTAELDVATPPADRDARPRPRAFRAILRQEVRILRHEVDAIVVLLLMPLVLIPVLMGPIEAGFAAEGRAVDGAQFVVVGQAVMFAFFLVTYMGFAVFREHGWNTWDRVIAGPVTILQVVAGKMVPWMVIGALQTAAIFGLGMVFWGLSVPLDTVPGIVLLTVVYMVFLAAFAMLLIAFTDSIMLLQALANLGAIALAAIGGAMVPVALLPAWLQTISPITPTYWVMRGYTDLLIEGEDWTAALLPCGVLVAMALVCGLLARMRFDPDEVKQFAE